MSKRFFILGLILVAGFLFLNVSFVKAETWTWTGGGDGQTWTDAKNWGLNVRADSDVSYPGATTTASVVLTANTVGLTVYATTTLDYGVNTLTLGAANIGWTNCFVRFLGDFASSFENVRCRVFGPKFFFYVR